ncbi:S-adenosyl-L-methionine-dependent methyltransferase [Dothidotthia symphoricarpi CBS 119687]|uniref:S-adenosyl-L-methionine-dependent methyltransferase n=1 Tax=Dothidotthia symphoricarpi CBS 119687 TaxID=1392245 RepID=A0A6A6A447_9PLEO|nr:S-adenosyl-L-methionine-dependent methyltransferase [Dothidotthia symphoricarpi CBS 119687]KAF2125894.1 S-adenosyl-L-methionine-dependent methyltransferase [Dothidotthia symphoricarpi CBS 119687]
MTTFSIRAFIPPLTRRCVPLQTTRRYAVQAPGAPTLEIFSNQQKWMQKERAASNAETSRSVDYLRDEVASRLCERVLDINRHFPQVLDLGANACNIARMLTLPSEETPDKGPRSKRIGTITAAESSETLLYRDADLPFNKEVDIVRQVLPTSELLPYEASTFDAVLSSLSLHWINDLPSVLAQVNHILKPDSPFMGVMMGGDSLYELRTSLQLAEQDRRGGVSTHTSPLADVRDVGGLLQKAGFNLLTVDVDDIIIDFPDTFSLMKDLQAMGESNAVLGREKGGIHRDVLLAADAIYRELHGNEDGTLPATFRLIYMIGWKPSPTQAKPLERGTGMFSIKDYLEKNKGEGGKE